MYSVFISAFLFWLSAVTAFQEKVYISEYGAEFLRARGLWKPLPDYIELDLTRADGDNVRLKLRENKKIDVNAPLYHTVLENGQLKTKVKSSKRIEGVKFYYDKEVRAALKVSCAEERKGEDCPKVVEGSVNINGENYDIRPSPNNVVTRNLGSPEVRHILEKAEQPTFTDSDDVTEIRDEAEEAASRNLEKLLRRLLEWKRYKRQGSGKTQYAVEVVGVADPTFWTYMEKRVKPREGMTKDEAVEAEIRQRIAHIVHGVSMNLEGMEDPEFSIYATISGFYMMKTIDASSPMAKYLTYTAGEGYPTLTVDRSEYLFAVRDELASKGIPHDDHYMVFTWVDLNGGAIGVAGGSGCCYTNRLSVNEYKPSFYSMILVASHELGHNIGARHDHLVGCPDNYYIMYSGPTYLTRGDTEYNKVTFPWSYSPCTVKSVREFLKEWGGKCLLNPPVVYDQTKWEEQTRILPGERYNADEQCKLVQGDFSYMCRREIPPTDPEFCIQMSCLTAENSCYVLNPAEGTQCSFPSSNKYCRKGKCEQKPGTTSSLVKTGDAENCFNTYTEGYVGTRSVTKSGLTCQSWSSQSPHSHTLGKPENFLDASVLEASNYCRDPDQSGKPWCFLSEYWELCDIPQCSAEKEAECSQKILEYQYSLTKTKSGYTCQRWDAQEPYTHSYTDASKYPDATLSDAANFCRNPDGSARAWCYTTSNEKRWDWCDEKVICTSDSCYSKSVIYNGPKSTTKSGLKCQRWDKNEPHTNYYVNDPHLFPDTSVAEAQNFCRDPSRTGQPWCYLGVTWEECNIPKCS